MNNTRLWIALGAIVVLIIVVVSFRGRSEEIAQPSASVSPTASPTNSPTASAVTTATPVRSTGGSSGGSSGTLSYEDAIKKYGGTRIQFDVRCQAIPGQLTIKQGGAVMLDNRSGDARTISVGGVKHVLAGYGFKIIVPTSRTLPADLSVGCGSAINVGTIKLQK